MECRHIFPNGKRCRCRAVDTHVFCHHHAPQPRPRTLRPRCTALDTWREVRIHLASLAPNEVPAAILTLLSALLEDGPRTLSDRRAGALLRALVRRAGSVPFDLPTDPAPQPDSAFVLSQSIDRVCAIIARNKLQPVPLTHLQIQQKPSPRVVRDVITQQHVQNQRPSRTAPQGDTPFCVDKRVMTHP